MHLNPTVTAVAPGLALDALPVPSATWPSIPAGEYGSPLYAQREHEWREQCRRAGADSEPVQSEGEQWR